MSITDVFTHFISGIWGERSTRSPDLRLANSALEVPGTVEKLAKKRVCLASFSSLSGILGARSIRSTDLKSADSALNEYPARSENEPQPFLP